MSIFVVVLFVLGKILNFILCMIAAHAIMSYIMMAGILKQKNKFFFEMYNVLSKIISVVFNLVQRLFNIDPIATQAVTILVLLSLSIVVRIILYMVM